MPSEPLDYETPGAEPLPSITCSTCGGTDVVEGRVGGVNHDRFWPRYVKRFWKFNSGVKTVTYACLSCGTVTTVVDRDELRRLIEQGGEEKP
jgi:hypothetical protein